MEQKKIVIRGRYDPSAATQLSNLPLPDSVTVELDGAEIGTLGEIRSWVREYEKIVAKNPLRKRNKRQNRDWLQVE